MSTITTLNDGITGASFRGQVNTNFANLNTDKLESTDLKTVNGNSLVGSGDLVISGGGSVATDAIWDSKGDLAGGTGANTASRLAVGTNGQVLTADSAEATGLKWSNPAGGGDALTSGTLAQFAATTSLELKGVISDETGSGSLVFANSPTLVTPALGTPASGTLTNCTGLPLSGVVDSTSEALGVGTLELGHASDTTISRVSAGVIAVEGIPAIIAGSTTVGQVPTITGTNTYSWQTPSSGGIGTTGFSVKLTSAQSITNTLSIVQFSNEEFDDGSNFNTGTYTYTAPSTGKYHIGYTIFIDSLLVDGDLVYVIMRKNGSTAMLYDYTRAGGAELSKIASRFFSLTAGDTIDIRIANSTASRGNISANLSWFYGYKLP